MASSTTTTTSSSAYQRFISAARAHELISAGGNVHILDTRTPEEFAKDHIAKAVNVRECFTYLIPNSKPDGVADLTGTFAELFSKAGIANTPDETVIVYEDGMSSGFAQSCRAFYLVTVLGHKNVMVMNGGLQGWKLAGYPVTSEPSTPTPATFKVDFQTQLFATADDILKVLSGETQYILLDDRDKAEWVGNSSSPYGIDFTPRKGRIPGAVWMEWYDYMEKDANGLWTMKSKEAVTKLLAGLNITPSSKVICYCFKGSRASHTLMCLLECGLTDVRNYFGSWNEWSRDMALPIDDKKL